MLVVETIARIRREHLSRGKSIKEIARDLKISRNTVRKILRSGETSFSYEREIQPRPKLGRWKADIDRMLTKNADAPARERLTLIRLFEELRAVGYEGGYDAVRRYAKIWSREGFVTLPTKERDGPAALEILSGRDCLAPRAHRRGAKSAMR